MTLLNRGVEPRMMSCFPTLKMWRVFLDAKEVVDFGRKAGSGTAERGSLCMSPIKTRRSRRGLVELATDLKLLMTFLEGAFPFKIAALISLT